MHVCYSESFYFFMTYYRVVWLKILRIFITRTEGTKNNSVDIVCRYSTPSQNVYYFFYGPRRITIFFLICFWFTIAALGNRTETRTCIIWTMYRITIVVVDVFFFLFLLFIFSSRWIHRDIDYNNKRCHKWRKIYFRIEVWIKIWSMVNIIF